jgi:hypothetical protein
LQIKKVLDLFELNVRHQLDHRVQKNQYLEQYAVDLDGIKLKCTCDDTPYNFRITLVDSDKKLSLTVLDMTFNKDTLEQELNWLYTGSWVTIVENFFTDIEKKMNDIVQYFDRKYRLPSVLS